MCDLGARGAEAVAAAPGPRQAAALAVGAPRPEAAGRLAATVTLSVDPRVADGVRAAAFLDALGTLIEDPRRLLL